MVWSTLRFSWGSLAITLSTLAACTSAPDAFGTSQAAATEVTTACAAVEAIEYAWAAYGDGCAHATGRGATSCVVIERAAYAGRAFLSEDDACNIRLNLRGSADFTDVLADMNFVGEDAPTPLLGTWRIFGSGAGVHPGFRNTLEGLQGAVDQTIERAKACGDRARIRIYGHSLGGSVGILMHGAIRDALPNVPIHTETFGAPSAGNCDWAKTLEKEDMVHHTNEHDILWRLPPIGFGYCHNPGKRIAYEDDQSIPFYRMVNAHLPQAYVFSAKKACDAGNAPPAAAQPVAAPDTGRTSVNCSDPRPLADPCWDAIAGVATNYRRAVGFDYWSCGDYRAYYAERPTKARDDDFWICDALATQCVERTKRVCAANGIAR